MRTDIHTHTHTRETTTITLSAHARRGLIFQPDRVDCSHVLLEGEVQGSKRIPLYTSSSLVRLFVTTLVDGSTAYCRFVNTLILQDY